MIERPDGIIVTISKKMYEGKGYRHWLLNFRHAMIRYDEDWYYWIRVKSKPIHDASLLFVYLCIGNKIRFRGYYGGTRETPEGFKQFDDGRKIHGRFWILIAGPAEKAIPYIPRQGFQGYRYTNKLF